MATVRLTYRSMPVSISSSASACGMVRGKPSIKKPLAVSGSCNRSLTMPMTTVSGTSSPASMYRLASRPMAVSFLTAERRMSPVEMCGMPYLSTMRPACVPLPAPGGPNRIRLYCAMLSPSPYFKKPS